MPTKITATCRRFPPSPSKNDRLPVGLTKPPRTRPLALTEHRDEVAGHERVAVAAQRQGVAGRARGFLGEHPDPFAIERGAPGSWLFHPEIDLQNVVDSAAGGLNHAPDMDEQIRDLAGEIEQQDTIQEMTPLITLDIMMLPIRLALGIGLPCAKPGKLTLCRLAIRLAPQSIRRPALDAPAVPSSAHFRQAWCGARRAPRSDRSGGRGASSVLLSHITRSCGSPGMRIDEFALGRVLHQVAQEHPRLGNGPAENGAGMGRQEQAAYARSRDGCAPGADVPG